MRVKSINLLNYRNYTSFNTELSPGLNIIIGDNAQGKTNLLEAIYFMSTLRSFRTLNDRDCIQFSKDYFRIQCDIENKLSEKKCQVVVFKNGKSIKINETIIKRSSDYIGTLNCVIFSPYDLNFFDDSPRVRRKFIDIEATKISNQYLVHLNQYFEVLKQRNALLKQPLIDDDILNILDHQMIEHMWVIVDYRNKMINYLNQRIGPLFDKLSKETHKIELKYKTEVISVHEDEFKQSMLEKLKQNKVRDTYFKITHLGCHRDDIEALMDDLQLTQVASQGQKRLVQIALKLALVDYIAANSNEVPVLLLDDVFSELDKTHQKKFLENCPTDSQIILTTTSIEFIKEIENPMTIYEIKQGQLVTRRNLNG